jgi:hypothetical protein
MANFFDDNDDLKFYFDKYLDWGPLVELTEYKFRAPDAHASTEEALEFYREVLTLVGQFTAEEVAPHAEAIDREHPILEDGIVRFPEVQQRIYEQVNELGVHGLCLPRELGGMNAPYIVMLMMTEMFSRADVSVAAHVGFHGGMALAGLMFSFLEGTTEFDPETSQISETRFAEMIGEIAEGAAWGSMDITEPGAGSDMAAMVTRGNQDENGNWFVTGQKIFITSGHAKYHYVIARTEEGGEGLAGLNALSMFLVKAFEDNPDGSRTHFASFDKLEDKLGHHGSATVAVTYERSPAELLGKRGEGFKLMLLLMNNARLGVGMESLGICEAACRMARAYAEDRPSMGKNIARHEMIADYLDEMETDTKALRAMVMEGAYHEELGHKIRLMLHFLPPENAEEKKRAEAEMLRLQKISRRLTPLVKYFGSEKAVEMARRCIQIHGGYGYITEYPAEKLLRDAMVLPIYEGTSQIQALMAMKDSLVGVLKDPGGFVRGAAGATWRRWFATGDTRRVAKLQARQYSVLRYLLTRLALTKLKGGLGDFKKDWDPKKDFALAMLHAERLIKLLTDVAVAEILLEQAQRHPDRVPLLHAYLDRAESRTRALHFEITHTGGRMLGKLAGQEA